MLWSWGTQIEFYVWRCTHSKPLCGERIILTWAKFRDERFLIVSMGLGPFGFAFNASLYYTVSGPPVNVWPSCGPFIEQKMPWVSVIFARAIRNTNTQDSQSETTPETLVYWLKSLLTPKTLCITLNFEHVKFPPADTFLFKINHDSE